jgi:hypothetical protein
LTGVELVVLVFTAGSLDEVHSSQPCANAEVARAAIAKPVEVFILLIVGGIGRVRY